MLTIYDGKYCTQDINSGHIENHSLKALDINFELIDKLENTLIISTEFNEL